MFYRAALAQRDLEVVSIILESIDGKPEAARWLMFYRAALSQRDLNAVSIILEPQQWRIHRGGGDGGDRPPYGFKKIFF